MDNSELGLSPAAAAARTTITDLGSDLLCEILLLLPSLPSLVRAAVACPTFLHAVRSRPSFRRRFQRLHPPQILGFFLFRTAFPTFAPLRIRSDPDLAAAVRGSDFFLTHLPQQDSADSSSRWEMSSCHGGYVVLVNHTARRISAYNPLTQAGVLFPMPPKEMILPRPSFYECHAVISEEDQQVCHMLYVQRSRQVPMSVAVCSLTTREWQVLPAPPPQPTSEPPQPHNHERTFYTGTQVNGSIYWKHTTQAYLLVFNTVTLHFSRLDLPLFMKKIHEKVFSLGRSKDGKLCVVAIDSSDASFGTLIAWVWRAGANGAEKWICGKFFPLYTLVDEKATRVYVEAVIDGFAYLSVKYDEQPESLISLCLKTTKLNKLFDDTFTSPAHPYIMMWPTSLVCNKARRSRD